jgi:hypothetical protein
MPNTPDGVYARRPWIAPAEAAYPPQAYIGPFASNQEQQLTQALASLTTPGPQLQEYVRPNLPQIQLFPPRFGYETREYGIADMIDVTSSSRMTERVDTAKPAAQAESSSRNTLGNGV